MALDLTLCALALARSLPLAWLMPLGARDIPRTVALSLWLALAALLYAFSAPVSILSGPALLKALLCEVGLGALFAAACAAPFVAISWVGQLSHASLLLRGRAEDGPMSALFRLAALNVFFMLGGQRALCIALISSLEDVPLGLSRFGTEPFLASLAQLTVDVCALSLALALPLLLTVWIVDLGLSLLARAAGHAPVLAGHSALRFAMALVVLGLTFTPVIDAFPSAVRDGMESARSLIRTLAR